MAGEMGLFAGAPKLALTADMPPECPPVGLVHRRSGALAT